MRKIVIFMMLTFSIKAFGFFEVIRAKEKLAESTFLLNSISDLADEMPKELALNLETLEALSEDLERTLETSKKAEYLSDEARAILKARSGGGSNIARRIRRATNSIRRTKRLMNNTRKLYGLVHPSAIGALEQKETNNHLKDIALHIKEEDALREKEKLYRIQAKIEKEAEERKTIEKEFRFISSHSEKNGTYFFRPYRVKLYY